MIKYSLMTTWMIPESIDAVWRCLIDAESWPIWWKYVEKVEHLSLDKPSGNNNVIKFCWRTCLPYRLFLYLRVVGIQPKQRILVDVSGDLKGEGSCQLTYLPDIRQTQVSFYWHVQTCKTWMIYFSYLLRPLFIWNHSRVMKSGERGLIQFLAATHLSVKPMISYE